MSRRGIDFLLWTKGFEGVQLNIHIAFTSAFTFREPLRIQAQGDVHCKRAVKPSSLSFFTGTSWSVGGDVRQGNWLRSGDA